MAILNYFFYVALIYGVQSQPVLGQTTLCESQGIPGSTVCETTPNILGLGPLGLNTPLGLNVTPNLATLAYLQSLGIPLPNIGYDFGSLSPYGQLGPLGSSTVCENANLGLSGPSLPIGLQRPLTKTTVVEAAPNMIGLSGIPNILGLGVSSLPFGLGGLPFGLSRPGKLNSIPGLSLGGSLGLAGLPVV